MNPNGQAKPNWLTPKIGIMLLTGVLITAAIPRIYDLGGESLWLDESFSWYISSHSISKLLSAVLRIDFNPPLYYIILHYWTKFFGISEISLRMPSVIYSITGIALFYFITAWLTRRSIALIATLIAALTLYDIRFAQEARAYALLNCLSAVSILAYLKLLRNYSGRWLTIYLIGSALLLYSHPYGIFPIVTQNIHWLLLMFRRVSHELSWKRWIALQSALIILFLPWIQQALTVVQKVNSGHAVSPKPGLAEIWTVFLKIGAYHTPFTALLLITGALSWLPTFRARHLRQESSQPGGLLFFVSIWFFSGLLLPFIASYLFSVNYSHRYVIIMSYPLYLLIALGISNIPVRPGRWCLTLLILGFSLVPIYRYYPKVQKEQWRDAVAYVENHAQPGSTILFHAAYCLDFPYAYYAHSNDLKLKYFPIQKVLEHTELSKPKAMQVEIEPLLTPGSPTWLVESHGETSDPDGLLLQALETRLGTPKRTAFMDITIYQYPELP